MRTFSSDPVPVELGTCYCPGSPHETDIVYLAPQLSMAGGMAAQAAIAAGFSDPIKLQELLADIWIRHGVTGWNFVDEDGNPQPLTDVMAQLPYGKGGRLVADKADDLYAEDVLAPLVALSNGMSRRGPTNGSTSAIPRSTTKRRSRSSTATTAKALRSA